MKRLITLFMILFCFSAIGQEAIKWIYNPFTGRMDAIRSDATSTGDANMKIDNITIDTNGSGQVQSKIWGVTGDDLENLNTGDLNISTELHMADSSVHNGPAKYNDTINFERDAIPTFEDSDPVYSVFGPRKTDATTNRQMAALSLKDLYDRTQDTLGKLLIPSVYATWLRDSTGKFLYTANPNDYVQLDNWLKTDYITVSTTNQENTMLGYGAFEAQYRTVDTSIKSTYIGARAGWDAENVTNSIMLGYKAGSFSAGDGPYLNNSNNENTFVGYESGYGTGVSKSAFYGAFSGKSSGSAEDFKGLVGLGYYAAYGNINTGFGTAIGYEAGRDMMDSPYYIAIGYGAGKSSAMVENSIFIGSNVGSNLMEKPNQLWIDNSDTTAPLIEGHFSTNHLIINGDLTVTGNVTESGINTFTILDDPADSVYIILATDQIIIRDTIHAQDGLGDTLFLPDALKTNGRIIEFFFLEDGLEIFIKPETGGIYRANILQPVISDAHGNQNGWRLFSDGNFWLITAYY